MGECSPFATSTTLRTLLGMPTADRYRWIAARLETDLGSVIALLRPIAVTFDPSPFDGGGGQLERTVNTTLAVAESNVVEVATELRHQIDEANRRAEICERYSAAVRDFRRLNDPSKTIPRPPASWADVG
jgi:hypothetical protein